MAYLLLFLIIVGIILNRLSKKYTLFGVTYQREISKKILEIGEDFHITTVVENRKLFPVTFLQIIERFPAGIEYKFRADQFKTVEFLYHTITMFLLPFQRIKRVYTAVSSKRGRYIFEDVSLIGGDLLGLNTFVKSIRYNQELIVLPKSIDLERELIPYGNYNGNLSVQRWIIDDPTMIIGVKEYTGLEPAKIIHWPSSLRTGNLMVKKFDFTLENTAMIILNVECDKPFWVDIKADDIEKCISITRSVMERFESMGMPYGFATNSIMHGLPANRNIVYPSLGISYLETLLECLGRASYSVSLTFEELLSRLSRRDISCSTYVIITPKVLDSYVEPINSLASELEEVILISLKDE
ncbi:DUF58 domain-containing protein, partial [bacterium]|nr:DUF58 domain-containing protein [bacterium]